MELKDRVKQARNYAGLTQDELVDRVKALPGVKSFSQQAITKLENGVAQKSAFLPHIAMICGVNSAWLATGMGEMIPGGVKELPADYNANLIFDTSKLDPETEEQIAELIRGLENGDISKDRFLYAAKLLSPEKTTSKPRKP